jgi:hypothetical protein
MVKVNYQFEKRKKELARQKKNEEKRLRKLEKKNQEAGISPQQPPAETEHI